MPIAGRHAAGFCIVILAALPLMGCANHVFRSFDLDRGESLSVDAKQRLVLVTHKGGKTGDRKIVCAEPSPDAYSAAAASAAAGAAGSAPVAGQGGTASASGGLAVARSEAAASLAMRTQTIQLLRDGLYRACEAYMNGAIDQYQYNILLLNIDRLMVSLLGVDAIGGTPKAPASAISAAAPAVTASAELAAAGQGAGPGAAAAVTGAAPTGPVIVAERADPSGVQAEAIANIVLAANAHSAVPSLCISLLASGELRLDNPGQHSVLKSCDYLLQGLLPRAGQGPPTPNSYHMTPQPRVIVPAIPVSAAPAVAEPAAPAAVKQTEPATGTPAAAPKREEPAGDVAPAAPRKESLLAPGPLASAAREREIAAASAWRTAVSGEPGPAPPAGAGQGWQARVERPAAD